jgi:uncharacterized protein YuzE
MAIGKQQDVAPRIPDLDDISEDQIRVNYNRLADSLWMSFTGEPRPAYNAYVDDDTMFLIDLETNDVVGIEIEHFLARALRPRDIVG